MIGNTFYIFLVYYRNVSKDDPGVMQLVTIKDVAKKANVAVSTASYALNGVKKVSPKTKEKVFEAARELNYRKNGFASSLKSTSTKTIALILSDLSGPFYSELIRGVQDVATDNKYDLIACSSIGGEKSTAAKFLLEHRVDGCIVLASNITDDMLKRAVNGNFPVILLDRGPLANSTVQVKVDNKSGGYKATEYLIKKGHHDIAFVSGPSDSQDNLQRFAGYREALDKYNIPFKDSWVINGNFTRKGGESAANIIAAQEKKPTAIFFANDEMALGGIEAFKRRNVKIPEEISIIGFDDILEAKFINPALTTVQQPKYEMGASAAYMLFRMLKQEKVSDIFELHTDLIVRNSVIEK